MMVDLNRILKNASAGNYGGMPQWMANVIKQTQAFVERKRLEADIQEVNLDDLLENHEQTVMVSNFAVQIEEEIKAHEGSPNSQATIDHLNKQKEILEQDGPSDKEKLEQLFESEANWQEEINEEQCMQQAESDEKTAKVREQREEVAAEERRAKTAREAEQKALEDQERQAKKTMKAESEERAQKDLEETIKEVQQEIDEWDEQYIDEVSRAGTDPARADAHQKMIDLLREQLEILNDEGSTASQRLDNYRNQDRKWQEVQPARDAKAVKDQHQQSQRKLEQEQQYKDEVQKNKAMFEGMDSYQTERDTYKALLINTKLQKMLAYEKARDALRAHGKEDPKLINDIETAKKEMNEPQPNVDKVNVALNELLMERKTREQAAQQQAKDVDAFISGVVDYQLAQQKLEQVKAHHQSLVEELEMLESKAESLREKVIALEDDVAAQQGSATLEKEIAETKKDISQLEELEAKAAKAGQVGYLNDLSEQLRDKNGSLSEMEAQAKSQYEARQQALEKARAESQQAEEEVQCQQIAIEESDEIVKVAENDVEEIKAGVTTPTGKRFTPIESPVIDNPASVDNSLGMVPIEAAPQLDIDFLPSLSIPMASAALLGITALVYGARKLIGTGPSKPTMQPLSEEAQNALKAREGAEAAAITLPQALVRGKNAKNVVEPLQDTAAAGSTEMPRERFEPVSESEEETINQASNTVAMRALQAAQIELEQEGSLNTQPALETPETSVRARLEPEGEPPEDWGDIDFTDEENAEFNPPTGNRQSPRSELLATIAEQRANQAMTEAESERVDRGEMFTEDNVGLKMREAEAMESSVTTTVPADNKQEDLVFTEGVAEVISKENKRAEVQKQREVQATKAERKVDEKSKQRSDKALKEDKKKPRNAKAIRAKAVAKSKDKYDRRNNPYIWDEELMAQENNTTAVVLENKRAEEKAKADAKTKTKTKTKTDVESTLAAGNFDADNKMAKPQETSSSSSPKETSGPTQPVSQNAATSVSNEKRRASSSPKNRRTINESDLKSLHEKEAKDKAKAIARKKAKEEARLADLVEKCGKAMNELKTTHEALSTFGLGPATAQNYEVPKKANEDVLNKMLDQTSLQLTQANAELAKAKKQAEAEKERAELQASLKEKIVGLKDEIVQSTLSGSVRQTLLGVFAQPKMIDLAISNTNFTRDELESLNSAYDATKVAFEAVKAEQAEQARLARVSEYNDIKQQLVDSEQTLRQYKVNDDLPPAELGEQQVYQPVQDVSVEELEIARKELTELNRLIAEAEAEAAAIKIQAARRGFLAKSTANALRSEKAQAETVAKAAVKIQSIFRKFSAEKQLQKSKKSAITIQAATRGLLARSTADTLKSEKAQAEKEAKAAVKIQSLARAKRAERVADQKNLNENIEKAILTIGESGLPIKDDLLERFSQSPIAEVRAAGSEKTLSIKELDRAWDACKAIEREYNHAVFNKGLTKLQSIVRGNNSRMDLAAKLENDEATNHLLRPLAAIQIQSMVRQKNAVKRVEVMKQNNHMEQKRLLSSICTLTDLINMSGLEGASELVDRLENLNIKDLTAANYELANIENDYTQQLEDRSAAEQLEEAAEQAQEVQDAPEAIRAEAKGNEENQAVTVDEQKSFLDGDIKLNYGNRPNPFGGEPIDQSWLTGLDARKKPGNRLSSSSSNSSSDSGEEESGQDNTVTYSAANPFVERDGKQPSSGSGENTGNKRPNQFHPTDSDMNRESSGRTLEEDRPSNTTGNGRANWLLGLAKFKTASKAVETIREATFGDEELKSAHNKDMGLFRFFKSSAANSGKVELDTFAKTVRHALGENRNKGYTGERTARVLQDSGYLVREDGQLKVTDSGLSKLCLEENRDTALLQECPKAKGTDDIVRVIDNIIGNTETDILLTN